jgi:hypothetical protein
VSRSVNIEFLGTAEQARNPITHSLKDIADNPHLYALTQGQRDTLVALNTRNDTLLYYVNKHYGTDIGRFQPNPGGAHLPNIDRGAKAIAWEEAMGGTASFATGRGRTRIFQTARDRMEFDKDFFPELNFQNMLRGMDDFKAGSAAREVYKTGIGGLTRIEVVDLVHPGFRAAREALTARVSNLNNRLDTTLRKHGRAAGAADRAEKLVARHERRASVLQEEINRLDMEGQVDWGNTLKLLSSEVNDAFRKAGALGKEHIRQTQKASASRRAQQSILRELEDTVNELQQVRRNYKDTSTGDYTLVGAEGGFRYFPVARAGQIKKLASINDNPFVSFLESIRQTVLAGDLSPITGVQTPLGFWFDPWGATKQWVGGLRRMKKDGDVLRQFRTDALADDIAGNIESWTDYAFYTGQAVRAGIPAEFAGGLLKSIPGFTKANEGMFVGVLRQSKRMFDDLTKDLEKVGVSGEASKAAAADAATKVYPMLNPKRLGLSEGRAKTLRSLVTSVSFIRQPISLVDTATRGFVKMGTFQQLTPSEMLAVRLMSRFTTSTISTSIASHLFWAEKEGKTIDQAIADAINPTKGESFSLKITPGRTLPIGGPFRGILKAIWPREVEGMPFPVPFAGLGTFAQGRITPALRQALDQAFNRDFFDNRVRLEDAGPIMNIIRTIAYGFEGLSPIAAGEVIEGIRLDKSKGDTVMEAAIQLLGTNVRQDTPFQERDAAVRRWAVENGLGNDILGYYDLDGAALQQSFDAEHPTIAVEIEEEDERRSRLGNDSSKRRVRSRELRDEQLKYQREDDRLWQAGTISSADWRDNRSERKTVLNARRDELYQNINVKEPEDPADDFYSKIDELKTKHNGVLTSEAWDELDMWVAGLSADAQRYIEVNTGLGERTTLERQFQNDVEILKPYFDVGDDFPKRLGLSPEITHLWKLYLGSGEIVRHELAQIPDIADLVRLRTMVRQELKSQRPEIDVARVRWYDDEPRTEEGEIEKGRRLGSLIPQVTF